MSSAPFDDVVQELNPVCALAEVLEVKLVQVSAWISSHDRPPGFLCIGCPG
jgi:hypothetical protein